MKAKEMLRGVAVDVRELRQEFGYIQRRLHTMEYAANPVLMEDLKALREHVMSEVVPYGTKKLIENALVSAGLK